MNRTHRAGLSAALLVLLATRLWAATGRLETADGRKFEGDLRPDGSVFVVTGTNGPSRIPLDQIRLLHIIPTEKNSDPTASAEVHGLRGSYFKNSDLTGPSATRFDPEINFKWGEGKPMEGIGPGNFSVRWEGQVRAAGGGQFTFATQSDGGVRLWVNGRLLINQWEQAGRSHGQGTIDLQQERKYALKVEYAGRGNHTAIKLAWGGPNVPRAVIPTENLFCVPFTAAPATRTTNGLLGLYFNEPDFTGGFLTSYDAKVEFDWGEGPPRDGINREKFSVRWLGQLVPRFSEPYTFRTVVDDCVRLWLNDQLIIDGWTQEPSTLNSTPLPLEAGRPCDLRLEMANSRGGSKMKLYWGSPSTPRAIVPADQFRPGAPPTGPMAPLSKKLPAGVILTGGSVIARRVQQADDETIRFSDSRKEPGLSIYHVARLVYQPLTSEMEAKIPRGQAGVLLPNGQFVECEFKGVAYGRVKMSSVLFGLKSYDPSQVVAVVLRDLQPVPTRYELHTRDGSLLLANAVRMEKNFIAFADTVLAPLKIPAGELVDLKDSATK